MKFKNLHKFVLTLIFISNTFAGTLGKSHSAELLSRGRSVPMSISNDTLVIAKTFSSLLPRTVDIYDVDKNANILTKIGELNSPNPMPGDDFGYSLDISGDYLIIGSAKLVWWVIPIMLLVGFLTPWPYNYWRLKKFNKSCH